MTEKTEDAVIQLTNVRIAFPQLFEAKAVKQGDQPAFSASFLLTPDHPDLAKLKAEIQRVAVEKWGDQASDVLRGLVAADKVCLHNGDTKAQYDGYKGNFFVTARSKVRPLVIDRNRSPLTEADGKPYSGSYVNVQLSLWAQQNGYGKRINAQLQGVQFFADGEAFGGGRVANADEFEALDNTADDAPPAAGSEFEDPLGGLL